MLIAKLFEILRKIQIEEFKKNKKRIPKPLYDNM